MRQTAAADAAAKPVAHQFQRPDAAVQIVAPRLGYALPFLLVQRLSRQGRVQGLTNFGQRNSCALTRLDDRQNAQAGTGIAPVIGGISGGMQQSLTFIKVDRRNRDTAAL